MLNARTIDALKPKEKQYKVSDKDGLYGLIFNLSDNWWLFFGVLSFLISIILPILMTTGLGEQPKVKQTLTKTLETQIN